MAKKLETNFQPKFTRNDRFAQMSHQEKLIEQKKKEILAKLEANEVDTSKPKSEPVKSVNKSSSSTSTTNAASKDAKNVFSNDGSFLDQFKQLKESKKNEMKSKSLKRTKDLDKCFSEERNKSNRWTSRRRSPSPKDRLQKRVSRFSSDKVSNFEQKITISTSFSSSITQSLENQHITPVIAQDVIGQPLLKNMAPDIVNYPLVPQQEMATSELSISESEVSLQQTEVVITSPPVLLNIPPPQIVQGQISNTLLLNQSQPTQNLLVSTSLQPILTTINLPQSLITNPQTIITTNVAPVPPPCLPTVELASIPPPNPIQVQNIPQPEPINTLNIPQPDPIQVQNIPTPNSIQLNEIPNPKPLDLMAIPTPNEDKSMCDADFLKNIPPPNKSVPPPQLNDNQIQTITIPIPQNVLTIQNIQTAPSAQLLQTPQSFSSVTVALVSSAPTLPNPIPSLMAQPILPPPGMGLNCPPPLLSAGGGLQVSLPSYINRPPPMINQMPPALNMPPPSSVQMMEEMSAYDSLNTGSAEYESMASLARMVAECGQCIEDMVVQRKSQDPNLWFLHRKNSPAYQQYRRVIEEIKRENELKRATEERQLQLKTEDKYEPEQALEEEPIGFVGFNQGSIKDEIKDEFDRAERKRKRRSRWGDKDINVAPPSVLMAPQTPLMNAAVITPGCLANQIKPTMLLSKMTRNDPNFLMYVSNAYKTLDLSEEDWKKAEDNYKVHLLFQDMLRKREEAERLAAAGKQKYEYDSDEDTEGGTWEHKIRKKEMTATQLWAQELTRQAEGKHHIGDFLPPEEYKHFMEKSSAVKEGRQPNLSDYKEFKIKEDNIGFKMLQKLGWSEGEGLGSSGSGILEPVNKGAARDHTQGLGLNEMEEGEDEYDTYRKRMMLAYRFRPNPMNNPRRPYY